MIGGRVFGDISRLIRFHGHNKQCVQAANIQSWEITLYAITENH